MNIVDRIGRILSREDETQKKNSMTIDNKSRAWIEVYKDKLEKELIFELDGFEKTYSAEPGIHRLDLFAIVLSGERYEYRNAIINLVAEYAIATSIAEQYDSMMSFPDNQEVKDIGYRCALIRYDDLASIHPNYRTMGGRLNRDRFYDLIEKVHEELS